MLGSRMITSLGGSSPRTDTSRSTSRRSAAGSIEALSAPLFSTISSACHRLARDRPHMPPTGLSGLSRAGILVRRAHRTGPSSLTVKLVAGHGAGARGSSGRDALMPPRLEDGLRDGRVPGDRGRSGDGHQPGHIQRPGLRLAAGAPEHGCGCPA